VLSLLTEAGGLCSGAWSCGGGRSCGGGGGSEVVAAVSSSVLSVLVGAGPATTDAGTRWANQVTVEVVWGWRAC
jgi:hypothetical protein